MHYCYSITWSCPTLCDSMDCSMPDFPVVHHLPELAQTHVHRVGDAIQLSQPLSSLSPPALYEYKNTYSRSVMSLSL